jgi:hypothetical protein
MKFCYPPDTRNIAACEFGVEILEILLQFFFGLTLPLVHRSAKFGVIKLHLDWFKRSGIGC